MSIDAEQFGSEFYKKLLSAYKSKLSDRPDKLQSIFNQYLCTLNNQSINEDQKSNSPKDFLSKSLNNNLPSPVEQHLNLYKVNINNINKKIISDKEIVKINKVQNKLQKHKRNDLINIHRKELSNYDYELPQGYKQVSKINIISLLDKQSKAIKNTYTYCNQNKTNNSNKCYSLKQPIDKCSYYRVMRDKKYGNNEIINFTIEDVKKREKIKEDDKNYKNIDDIINKRKKIIFDGNNISADVLLKKQLVDKYRIDNRYKVDSIECLYKIEKGNRRKEYRKNNEKIKNKNQERYNTDKNKAKSKCKIKDRSVLEKCIDEIVKRYKIKYKTNNKVILYQNIQKFIKNNSINSNLNVDELINKCMNKIDDEHSYYMINTRDNKDNNTKYKTKMNFDGMNIESNVKETPYYLMNDKININVNDINNDDLKTNRKINNKSRIKEIIKNVLKERNTSFHKWEKPKRNKNNLANENLKKIEENLNDRNYRFKVDDNIEVIIDGKLNKCKPKDNEVIQIGNQSNSFNPIQDSLPMINKYWSNATIAHYLNTKPELNITDLSADPKKLIDTNIIIDKNNKIVGLNTKSNVVPNNKFNLKIKLGLRINPNKNQSKNESVTGVAKMEKLDVDCGSENSSEKNIDIFTDNYDPFIPLKKDKFIERSTQISTNDEETDRVNSLDLMEINKILNNYKKSIKPIRKYNYNYYDRNISKVKKKLRTSKKFFKKRVNSFNSSVHMNESVERDRENQFQHNKSAKISTNSLSKSISSNFTNKFNNRINSSRKTDSFKSNTSISYSDSNLIKRNTFNIDSDRACENTAESANEQISMNSNSNSSNYYLNNNLIKSIQSKDFKISNEKVNFVSKDLNSAESHFADSESIYVNHSSDLSIDTNFSKSFIELLWKKSRRKMGLYLITDQIINEPISVIKSSANFKTNAIFNSNQDDVSIKLKTSDLVINKSKNQGTNTSSSNQLDSSLGDQNDNQPAKELNKCNEILDWIHSDSKIFNKDLNQIKLERNNLLTKSLSNQVINKEFRNEIKQQLTLYANNKFGNLSKQFLEKNEDVKALSKHTMSDKIIANDLMETCNENNKAYKKLFFVKSNNSNGENSIKIDIDDTFENPEQDEKMTKNYNDFGCPSSSKMRDSNLLSKSLSERDSCNLIPGGFSPNNNQSKLDTKDIAKSNENTDCTNSKLNNNKKFKFRTFLQNGKLKNPDKFKTDLKPLIRLPPSQIKFKNRLKNIGVSQRFGGKNQQFTKRTKSVNENTKSLNKQIENNVKSEHNQETSSNEKPGITQTKHIGNFKFHKNYSKNEYKKSASNDKCKTPTLCNFYINKTGLKTNFNGYSNKKNFKSEIKPNKKLEKISKEAASNSKSNLTDNKRSNNVSTKKLGLMRKRRFQDKSSILKPSLYNSKPLNTRKKYVVNMKKLSYKKKSSANINFRRTYNLKPDDKIANKDGSNSGQTNICNFKNVIENNEPVSNYNQKIIFNEPNHCDLSANIITKVKSKVDKSNILNRKSQEKSGFSSNLNEYKLNCAIDKSGNIIKSFANDLSSNIPIRKITDVNFRKSIEGSDKSFIDQDNANCTDVANTFSDLCKNIIEKRQIDLKIQTSIEFLKKKIACLPTNLFIKTIVDLNLDKSILKEIEHTYNIDQLKEIDNKNEKLDHKPPVIQNQLECRSQKLSKIPIASKLFKKKKTNNLINQITICSNKLNRVKDQFEVINNQSNKLSNTVKMTNQSKTITNHVEVYNIHFPRELSRNIIQKTNNNSGDHKPTCLFRKSEVETTSLNVIYNLHRREKI